MNRFSSLVSKHGHRDLVHGDELILRSLVFLHVAADSVLLSLRHSLTVHVVTKEIVKARDLVNESEIVGGDHLGIHLHAVEVIKDDRALVVHFNNEIFKLLFVHLEMLHDQIVCQPVSLVEVLPVVHHMVGVAINDPVNVHSVEVHRNEEEDGKSCTGIDMTSDIFVVEGDVNPSTGSRKPRSHY